MKVENKRTRGKSIEEEIVKRLKEVEYQEGYYRIRRSRYGKYERIETVERPEYLRKRCEGNAIRVLARFRCGYEERANAYWKKEEERKCMYCNLKEETLKYVLEKCGEETIRE